MKKTNLRFFTLVELILVVAIIGILMTLLLPSLENARAVSKQAVSMSNLKQIHLGTISYASNNDAWLFDHSTNWHPYAGINRVTGGRNSVMDWPRMTYESIIGKTLSRDDTDVHMALGTPYQDIFYCPVLSDKRPAPESISSYGSSTYSMNKFFGNNKMLTKLSGEVEPMYVGGTPHNSNPAVSHNKFQYGTYDPTSDKHPAFQYSNKRAIGLFIDGRIKLFSISKGAEIDSAIQSGGNFK